MESQREQVLSDEEQELLLEPIDPSQIYETPPPTPLTTSASVRGFGQYPYLDKPVLSEIGFDILDYTGEGVFAQVYNGICNQNAKNSILLRKLKE